MTELRRTKANGFSIEQAVTLEDLSKENLIPIEKALEKYEEITVSEAQSKRFHNGGALSYERLPKKPEAGIYRVYSPDRVLLGLGEITEDKQELAVKRVLVSDE